jgi:hypothetical protein
MIKTEIINDSLLLKVRIKRHSGECRNSINKLKLPYLLKFQSLHHFLQHMNELEQIGYFLHK